MSGEFELSVERHIDAPPEKVWQIMTGRITEWWCPRPWTTTIAKLDWRAGGAFHLIMRGPDNEPLVVDVEPVARLAPPVLREAEEQEPRSDRDQDDDSWRS